MSQLSIKTQGAAKYQAERRGCYDTHRPSTRCQPTLAQVTRDNRRMILEGFPIKVLGFDLEVLGPVVGTILRNKRRKRRGAQP